jgi:autotransporter-associated beta strand protein
VLANTVNLGSSTLTLKPGQNASAASGLPIVISGSVGGAGGIAVSGSQAATVRMSGADSYSGGTTISSGTLALSGAGSIGTGGLNLGTAASPGVFDLAALTQLRRRSGRAATFRQHRRPVGQLHGGACDRSRSRPVGYVQPGDGLHYRRPGAVGRGHGPDGSRLRVLALLASPGIRRAEMTRNGTAATLAILAPLPAASRTLGNAWQRGRFGTFCWFPGAAGG